MKNSLLLPPEVDSLLQKLIDLCQTPDALGIIGAKSSGIIIGGTQEGGITESDTAGTIEAKPSGVIIDGTQVGKVEAAPKLEGGVLEERHAYYRRCQHVRKNGRQCKAPALKGEQICYSHAGQIDAARRLERERREFLARPGLGLGDPNSIQRTLRELSSALLSGRISQETWGRLLMECQTAIQLQKHK